MQPVEPLLSDSKEMYLVTIARLGEPGQPVPLSSLAHELSVTSVSVNEMCRKLQDQGYLVYQPYQGAWLTESGEKLANNTLRRHRLWEVFLVDKLGFDYTEAHQVACQMEHITTDQLMDKLEQFLGFPKVNPIGAPIPNRNAAPSQSALTSVTELPVGNRARVIRCEVPESAALFFEEAGICPGEEIALIGLGNNNVLVQVNQEQVSLSTDLAACILVDQPGS